MTTSRHLLTDNPRTGTCPVCKDRLMAFEPVEGTDTVKPSSKYECGGCGSVSTAAEIVQATREFADTKGVTG